MNQKQWIDLTIDVMSRTEQPLQNHEISELCDNYIPNSMLARLNERVQIPLLTEIFSRGSAQQSFGDPNRLKEKILHDSVEDAFPTGSEAFLGLTRSFLTFRIETLDCVVDPPKTNIKIILSKIIVIYSDAFFPSPQVRKPVPPAFAKAQREFISTFGPRIDIDEFFRNNPLFSGSDRQIQQKSGCLVPILAIISGITFASMAYLLHNSI